MPTVELRPVEPNPVPNRVRHGAAARLCGDNDAIQPGLQPGPRLGDAARGSTSAEKLLASAFRVKFQADIVGLF